MLRGAPSQMLALNCTRGIASHRVPERQAAFAQAALVWYQDLNQVVPLLPRVDCDDAQRMTTATTKQKSQHLRPPCLQVQQLAHRPIQACPAAVRRVWAPNLRAHLRDSPVSAVSER